MNPPIKVALIGLDTSHSIEFTRLMQAPDCPPDLRVPGMTAVSCLRFPTPFQNGEGLDGRQRQLEAWGVRVTSSFEEAVEGCDALMLEINDPSLHAEYVERCAGLGMPLWLDKPLADTRAHGETLVARARAAGVPLFSSSNLRFAAELADARTRITAPPYMHAYGPVGRAPAGSSIVWYGVHTFEMLQAVMGRGAETLRVLEDGGGLTCAVSYPDGRRGLVELIDGAWIWGGELRTKDASAPFVVDDRPGYANMLKEIRAFFETGTSPVAMEDTLEVMALLDAAQRASVSHGVEPVHPAP
jgi:predicted dehydrogenase